MGGAFEQRRQRYYFLSVFDQRRFYMDDYTGQRTDFDILYRYRPCERYDIQLRGQSRERSGRGRPGYGGRNAGYRTYGAADPDSGRGQRTSNSYMGGARE